MGMLRSGLGMVGALGLLAWAVTAAAQDGAPEPVLAGYATPTVAIPYAAAKPTIDGVVDDAEWQGAVSFAALKTVRSAVSSRQTRYWVSWDEGGLYLAMRSPMREGERPVQAFRGEPGDPMVVFDDSYEFYFDTGGTQAGGLPAYVQYIGNLAGCKYDASHLPTVGIRRMAYEAAWQPRNRLVETPTGKVWEMEVRVPRESILVPEPLREGFVFKALLARNYKRPWEQNSLEGTAIFRNTATYTTMRLMKNVPAIHVQGIADAAKNTVGLNLQVFGSESGGTVTWRFATDSGVQQGGDVTAPAGTLVAGPRDLGLAPALDKLVYKKEIADAMRVQITTADKKTVLFDWGAWRHIAGRDVLATVFPDDQGEEVKLSLVLNPVEDYLRVAGDFINYDTRATIARCQVTVVSEAGRELAAATYALDSHAFVKGVVGLPGLQPGNYVAKLVARDAAGGTVLERETAFTKKDHAQAFPWWDTKHGRLDKVIPPWTPVTFTKGAFSVWGRTMTVGAAGLPAQIIAREEELLARPCELVAELADGKVTMASGKSPALLERADHRTVVQSVAALDKLQIESKVQVEFDGMYKVSMTLTPAEAMTVKSLKMVVPLKPEQATYLTALGEGIRWGYFYDAVPQGKGRVWDCRAVDGQRMAKGSFIPYIWTGGPRAGLCWYADTDAGWVPDDTVPAIEIRRDRPESVDLIFNLIGSPFTIDAPRTLVFAFQATPVKKLPADWRTRTYDFSDTFAEWQCGDEKGMPRMAAPVPWTFDVERCRKMVAAYRARPRLLSKYNHPVIPYGRHNEVFPRQMPEAIYFGEHWQKLGSWHIYYSKTLTDYWVHKLAEWIESCDIDGYYSDNTRPAICRNVAAGRGYLLPDGQVQPAYNIFGVREYFLRVRAVFAEHGKEGWIVTHMTHNMVMPWLGACDIALDGEDHHVDGAQNRTWLDAWPLSRIRATNPGRLGVAVTYKVEMESPHRWAAGHRYSYAAAWRSYAAGLQLHDVLPLGGYGYPTTWFEARDRFGLGARDVQFVGYWEPDSAVACVTKEARVSAWVRPTGVMLCVVGVGTGPAAQAEITLDAARLGLPKPQDWYVYDAEKLACYSYLGAQGKGVHVRGERDPALQLSPDGTLSVTVTRHDYRLIVVQNKAQSPLQAERP